MSAQSIVLVGLMAFVLLAPTMMVAVLVSGLARRSPAADRVEPDAPELWDVPQPAMPRPVS